MPARLVQKPIVDAVTQSDLVILTSPVYGFDVSGQMKALIDHLCFMWMSHRPNPMMFNKIGLTVATTAGAGLGHTAKTMKNSLTYWGVKKVFSYNNRVSAMKWGDVSEKSRRGSKRIRKCLPNGLQSQSKTPKNFRILCSEASFSR
jgi:multimeric flavodoxin WrbA